MIKLDVKNYCHDCEHFVAEVERSDIPCFTNTVLARAGDTIVRCEHRNICEGLVSRISTKEQTKCDHVWAEKATTTALNEAIAALVDR